MHFSNVITKQYTIVFNLKKTKKTPKKTRKYSDFLLSKYGIDSILKIFLSQPDYILGVSLSDDHFIYHSHLGFDLDSL